MPQPRRRRHGPQPDRRRALELLASRNGATEAIMLAHGFTVEQMADLCVAGLAIRDTRAHGRGRTHVRGRADDNYRGGAEGAGRNGWLTLTIRIRSGGNSCLS